MNNIQGFVTITDLISNVEAEISPVGELSTWAETYSLDRGYYRDSAAPGYELTTFSSIDINTGAAFMVQQSTVLQILQVVRASRAYAEANIQPYDPLDFATNLLLQFSGQLENVKVGEFRDYGPGALPEWISWSNLGPEKEGIKIWLVDQAFREQYDRFHIEVIPSIANLDMFFDEYSTMVQTLQALRPSVLSDKMQDAKETRPVTVSRIHDYYFVNSINPNQKTYVSWGLLIYGTAGDNIDSIKDALVDYILENSNHTRAEWEVVFPDIFKRTEFVIVPHWHKVSIDNITELSRLYSQITHPREAENFIKVNFTAYRDAEVEARLRLVPFYHKNLMLSMISGAGNEANNDAIEKLFPDFLPVPTTSYDFNRQGISTREWSSFIFDMVLNAESATEYSSVPRNLRRIRRNNVIFLSALFENVNYLVAIRNNGMFSV